MKKQIILDLGSGNTHKNRWEYCKKMITACKNIQKELKNYEIIIKHQLFKEAGDNKPLSQNLFDKAYTYAYNNKLKTTASVFDKESLMFLMEYDIPFVKIANNKKAKALIDYIPRGLPIYISLDNIEEIKQYQHLNNAVKLLCISKYPATGADYEIKFGGSDDLHSFINYGYGISDHTINFGLYKNYQPDFIEWHFKLSDSTGLDAGEFARTPEQIIEYFRGGCDEV
jgi:sialic acid synthase SpsE